MSHRRLSGPINTLPDAPIRAPSASTTPNRSTPRAKQPELRSVDMGSQKKQTTSSIKPSSPLSVPNEAASAEGERKREKEGRNMEGNSHGLQNGMEKAPLATQSMSPPNISEHAHGKVLGSSQSSGSIHGESLFVSHRRRLSHPTMKLGSSSTDGNPSEKGLRIGHVAGQLQDPKLLATIHAQRQQIAELHRENQELVKKVGLLETWKEKAIRRTELAKQVVDKLKLTIRENRVLKREVDEWTERCQELVKLVSEAQALRDGPVSEERNTVDILLHQLEEERLRRDTHGILGDDEEDENEGEDGQSYVEEEDEGKRQDEGEDEVENGNEKGKGRAWKHPDRRRLIQQGLLKRYDMRTPFRDHKRNIYRKESENERKECEEERDSNGAEGSSFDPDASFDYLSDAEYDYLRRLGKLYTGSQPTSHAPSEDEVDGNGEIVREVRELREENKRDTSQLRDSINGKVHADGTEKRQEREYAPDDDIMFPEKSSDRSHGSEYGGGKEDGNVNNNVTTQNVMCENGPNIECLVPSPPPSPPSLPISTHCPPRSHEAHVLPPPQIHSNPLPDGLIDVLSGVDATVPNHPLFPTHPVDVLVEQTLATAHIMREQDTMTNPR